MKNAATTVQQIENGFENIAKRIETLADSIIARFRRARTDVLEEDVTTCERCGKEFGDHGTNRHQFSNRFAKAPVIRASRPTAGGFEE